MKKTAQRFDLGTMAVIVLTLALFVVALFLKGLTHDILLEAGVFLVSVKVILLSYNSAANAEKMMGKLEEIRELVEKRNGEEGRAPLDLKSKV